MTLWFETSKVFSQDYKDSMFASNTLLKIEFTLCYQISNKTPNVNNNNNCRNLNSKMEGFHFCTATMKITHLGLFGPQ